MTTEPRSDVSVNSEIGGLSAEGRRALDSLESLAIPICLVSRKDQIVWTSDEFRSSVPELSTITPGMLVTWQDAVLEGLRFMTLPPSEATGLRDFTELGRDKSLIDPLTEAGNRLFLNRLLEAWHHDSKKSSISALLIDLDRFKQVNDTLGHEIGDALLVSVAQRLRSVVRDTDQLIRLGGDEFLILQLDSEQPEGPEKTAARVVDLLSRPFLCSGHQSNISASVGIACYPLTTDTPDDLVRHADLAMYQAKADGKGRAHVFHQKLAEAAEDRRSLELSLRKALRLGQFELVYQPQVTLPDGEVTGFEALIRWNHPEQGLISPFAFIPLAEELGEIVPIGTWVLNTACEQAMLWPKHLTVSVNASPIQLKTGDFVELVKLALERSGLEAKRLEIEITEGVLLEKSKRSMDALWALRELGVGIAMDDFGTGYSSLSYLHSFPFSKLKIDQSFIRNAQNERSHTLVNSMINLGNSLSMETIAEGVETLDQFEDLAEGGCAQAQGYYIAKPMAVSAIGDFLNESDSKKERKKS